MTKKVIVVLLVLVVAGALGVMALSAEGSTQHIDANLVGEIMSVGDGVGLFDVKLNGSPGQANVRGLSFTYPVDYSGLPPGNKCQDLNGPSGYIITTEGQLNMIFNDGSMLFANAAEGGYVCFVPIDDYAPAYAYAPYTIAGGTDRYADATGHVTFDITPHPFGPGSSVIPETGTASGEIVLP